MIVTHCCMQLHSIGLMCRDCFVFQERALDVGILSVASDCAFHLVYSTPTQNAHLTLIARTYFVTEADLTDSSPTVRKASASLLLVLFVGHARYELCAWCLVMRRSLCKRPYAWFACDFTLGHCRKLVQCQTCVMVSPRSVGMTGPLAGGRATRLSKQFY